MAESKALSKLDPLSGLFAFSRDVLGYDQLCELHLEWFKALLENQFLLLLAPRGHLKSTVATTCFPLWRLAKNRNLRILIIAETHGIAKKLLYAIQQQILVNEKFRYLYGSWDTNASKWTEDSITIPRKRVVKEPSITCCGVLGNLVSMHNDLIILDDAVSNGNSYTPGQREKLQDWFSSVILPALEPDGQLCIVGTRWHQLDLYSHILSSPGFNHWKKIVQRAEWQDENGTQHYLFPQRYGAEKLKELRGSMGASSYAQQMLNDTAASESEFTLTSLKACRYTERPENMNIYIGVDLASGSKEAHSRFGHVTIGIPKGQRDAYILEARREHIQFPEQVKTIKRLCHIWKPTLVCIESNAYQQSMLQVLRVDPETARLPIKGITTTGDKQRRISSLAVLFENGALRLPDGLHDLEDELLNFPRGRDDLLDALYLSLQAVSEMRVVPRFYYIGDAPEPDYPTPPRTTRPCWRCGGLNKLTAILCDKCGRRLGWDDP
jgi:predicted phage terminase large subunit-like protein